MSRTRRPRILFLAHRDGLSSIFASVVAAPAASMSRLGHDVDIACFATPGELVKPAIRRRWASVAREVEASISGRLVRLPGVRKSTPSLAFESAVLRAWGKTRFRARPTAIFCSGTAAAVLGAKLRDALPEAATIYHCLGPDAEEYLFSHGVPQGAQTPPELRAEAERRALLQAEAMRVSDCVVTISAPMREDAIGRYKVSDDKIIHAPCFVDSAMFRKGAEKRDEMRRVLGFGDDFVVGYCGSILQWQLSPRALTTLEHIRRHRPDARFLGITTGPNRLRELIAEAGFPAGRSTIMTVPWRDVPQHIAACDVGIVGRSLMEDEDVVNRQSSPIKFGEYLACGTPAILSEGIGDFSDAAARHGLGVVLPFRCTPEEADRRLGEFVRDYADNAGAWRERCMDYARTELDLDVHSRRLAERMVSIFGAPIA